MLKGKAKFSIHRNDMFWEFCIMSDTSPLEFFHGRVSGYNDSNWWDNVAEKASICKVTGSKGTVKTFKIDFTTCEVTEVAE